MATLALLLILLSLPVLAWGNAGVCGDADGVREFHPANVGPANIPAPDCFVIPENETTAQVALWDSTPDKRHLAVVGGVLVLKSQAAIDAIATADTAAAAAAAELAAEQVANPVCNATSLQEALAKIQTQKDAMQADIDAITTIATAKTALTTMNNRLTAIDANIVKCVVVLLRKL